MKNKIYTVLLATLFTFVATLAYSQSRAVSGVVSDSNGEPVIGATVMLKDTNTGTTTDLDGKFTISVKGNNPILEFSFIGMKDQQLAIGRKTSISITLEDETTMLDNVVVIGYGTVRKKELTGAVEQVKGDDVARMQTSDLSAALQGQIAGLSVSSDSGAPGESASILIRGISSISGSNTPLYVVDGVPQDGDPRISANEIETIDVLKDAASCAIYGTRGAAGVILITTKGGKEGKMKVDITSSYGIQELNSAIELMNANEKTYFDMVCVRNTAGTLDGDISLELNRRPLYYANDTDLRDAIFRSGIVPIQNHNVNLSGGANGLSYNITVGYFTQDGMLVNTDFERFNTRANINYKRDKVTLGANVSVQTEDRAVGAPSAIGMSLRYSAQQDMLEPGNTDPVYSDSGDFSDQLNWVAALLNTTDDRTSLKGSANFNFGYDILPSLNVSTRFSTSKTYGYQEYFKPYQEIYDSDGDLLSNAEDSTVSRTATTASATTWDATINYSKKFGKHSISWLGVVSTESYSYKGFYAEMEGIIDNDYNSFNSATINPGVSSTWNWQTDSTNTLFGALTRVLYNWDSRYMVSASVRVDGSSRFSKENRWGVFPSVSGAWNISDEKFFKPLKNSISDLKFRASYGTTGNQNITSYSYYNVVNYGYDAIFGETSNLTESYGATQDSFANTDIKWETTIQTNIGVDLSVLNNKLMVTAEYYNTRKNDMLFSVDLPSSSGIIDGGTMAVNMGNMTNQGYELSLKYRNTIKKLWYSVATTFSTNKNVVTSLPITSDYVLSTNYGLLGDTVTAFAEGYEAGAFFLYKTGGVVNTAEKLEEYQAIVPDAEMGDLIYLDSNGDGSITEDDRTYCGSGLPKFEIGLNLSLAYKNFDFYMQWYSALGHEIMNGAKMITYAYGTNKDLVGQWSEANPTSTIPSYKGTNSEDENYRGYTDLWLEDGSYCRLKNITLGYSLPKETLSKLNLSKVRFYISAQNLITFTNYTGYNPEVGGSVISRGVDAANYPASIIYTAGLNLSF
ncbi:MAG: TonB-dependent receptor [Rikenellaceae bacterium]